MNERPLITAETDGTFSLNLSSNERSLLGELPGELLQLLEGSDDDRSTFRLFPRAYEQDLGRQVEYDSIIGDELVKRHIQTLSELAESANSERVSLEQLDAWARAINLLRLVLGTRLDIKESTSEADFPANSPIANAYALYLYLGQLQDDIVDALARSLPPPAFPPM